MNISNCYHNTRTWRDRNHHAMVSQERHNQCLHSSPSLRSCYIILVVFATTYLSTTITTAVATRIVVPSHFYNAQRTQKHSFTVTRISQRPRLDQTILRLRGGDTDVDLSPTSDDDDDDCNLNNNDDDEENDKDAINDSNSSSDTATTTTVSMSNPTKISTTTTTITTNGENDKQYYIQQQLYLQSRSIQLRQALIQRGLHALAHSSPTTTTTSTYGGVSSKKGNGIKKVVDWECALSTEEYPKSCLYSLDAEYGQKVIAPMLPIDDDDDNSVDVETKEGKETKTKNKKYEWITISSLNRLYRTDPNKVETLWYDQYAILATWFSRTQHPYSLYTHFSQNIYATLITTALNLQPAWLLSVILILTSVTIFGIVFLPLIESGMTLLLTSSMLWNSWPTWSRFTTHAALPVQLLIVQILFGFLQQGIQSMTNQIRTILIDEECRLLQNCIPLTIIEGRRDTVDVTDVTIPNMDEEDEVDDEEIDDSDEE